MKQVVYSGYTTLKIRIVAPEQNLALISVRKNAPLREWKFMTYKDLLKGVDVEEKSIIKELNRISSILLLIQMVPFWLIIPLEIATGLKENLKKLLVFI